jgi:lipopolysaccharide transport system ATP-binding protein
LLKILTGVLEPTFGTYKTLGRVLSLLELSGGMDNDLSGRENIVRSAQLLGFPPGYVEEKMAQINDFAELGDFFDQPLGVYSSGMRIRLAFSMFAFLECDILILDEVLAVGDIFFRQKCYARLEELIAQNVAIILVTHSTGTVRQYCDDVIVLQNGRIIYHGDSQQAISKYFEFKKDQGININVSDTYVVEDCSFNFALSQKATELAKLIHLLVCNEQGAPLQAIEQGAKAYFYFAYQAKENMGVPLAELTLFTPKNFLIHSRNSLQLDVIPPLKLQKGDIVRSRQMVKLDLAPGNYIFNLRLLTMHPSDFKERKKLSSMDIKEKLVTILDIKPAGMIGVFHQFQSQGIGLHGGLCNLDGEMHIEVLRDR